MKNGGEMIVGGRGSGGLDSTETLWNVRGIERVYTDRNGVEVGPLNYDGDGEILYERFFDSPGGGGDSRLNDDVNRLSESKIEMEDSLIFVLSQLYGKRDGKYLSRVLEKVENDEWGFYKKEYNWGQSGGYSYIEYLRTHDSSEGDEEFYKFMQWYDYAFKRYAREKFLPEARRYEAEYVSKVRAEVESGLLPESTIQKLALIEAHEVKYAVVDAFNRQDIGGSCSRFNKDNPIVTYHVEFGLDEKTDLPLYYSRAATNFQGVLAHELSHLLVEGLFGVYGSTWDYLENRTKLSELLPDSLVETVVEADRIVVEGVTEWLKGILIGDADESKADTDGGVYHVERQVIDDLLNGGLERVSAREFFALCDESGEELETNRSKLVNVLLLAYPDCHDKYDLAEKICERFNWFEYLDSRKGDN